MIVTEQCGELIMQLRHQGIRDARVLAAIESVPREQFVTPPFVDSAYANMALPIACGQTISQPFVVAYMTEKLAVKPNQDVLEIGTGSGYQAAILAKLCRHVYSIERHEPLYREAMQHLERLGLTNVTLACGDGSVGWPDGRMFDRIIVTAASATAPKRLLRRLREGGRLIAPVGRDVDDQQLVQYDRTPEGIVSKDLLAVRFVPLIEDHDTLSG